VIDLKCLFWNNWLSFT